MSTRDKSDFGSGKILPDELPDAAPSDAETAPHVHPERAGATGPDIAAAQRSAALGHGTHLRDEPGDVHDEPVEAPHPPRHARPDGTE